MNEIEPDGSERESVERTTAPDTSTNSKAIVKDSDSGREEIDRFLAQLDEEAIAEEIEFRRDIEEAHRRRWWTFGIRTFVP